jgi:hypothetical protein
MSSTINGTGVFTSSYTNALSKMRNQFDALTLQLATGQKSPTYGGLGVDRGIALALNGKVSAIDSYKANIQQVSLRTNMMMTSLTSLTDIANQTRADLDPNAYLLVDGTRTIAQQAALTRFDTAIEALNVNVAGVHLFGGRDVSSPPVAPAKDILNGTVSQAGLRTVMAERKAADLGADGRGRLTQATATGATVTLAESSAPNAFGFKLGAVSTNAPSAYTVSSASGTPPQIGVQLAGTPKPGDVVRMALTLPDGSTEEISLTASNNPPAPELVARVNGKELPVGTVGATALSDPMIGLSVGDTISVNGQQIQVVASGAVAGQINANATLDDLSAQIEGLSGVASVDFDPATRQIRITGTNGTDLSVTGTVGSKLGLNGTVKAEELKKHTFQIVYDGSGAVDLDATARNFATALDGAVKKEAQTTLVAASAIKGSRDFFGNPPMRVDGTPPETATGLVDGSANTIAWYRGENGPGSARETQSARIDSTLSAQYGARANEDGVREMMENLGAFAAMELDTTDEQVGKAQYTALVSRIRPALASDTGIGPLESLVTQIANVSGSIEAAKDRHQQSEAVAKSMLADIEGISKDDVAASILALQTNLQASYQVTAIASQLSLVNFL